MGSRMCSHINLLLEFVSYGPTVVSLRKNVCTVNDTLRIMRNGHRMNVCVRWSTIVR